LNPLFEKKILQSGPKKLLLETIDSFVVNSLILLIFAQRICAKIKGRAKRAIFTHLDARNSTTATLHD